MPPSPLDVLSPSDSAALVEQARHRLAGRVCQTTAAHIMLADAFATAAIELRNDQVLPPINALCIVDALHVGGQLLDGVLEEVIPSHRESALAREHDRLHRLGIGANLMRRAQMMQLVRDWFSARGFIEVDTPQRVPSPGLDLHLDAFSADGAYLITSPEYQMKRLLAGGMPRVMQIVHCFRDGELGTWHNPEFSMLEWYRAFSGVDALIDDTEQLIAHIAQHLAGSSKVIVNGREIDVLPPFERMTVAQAFERFAGVKRAEMLRWAATDEDKFFRTLVEMVEPELATLPRGLVLLDFPSQQASLARLRPSDPAVCERFEIYVGGLELCNGFGELTDPVEQRARLVRDQQRRLLEGKPVYPVDETFVEALVDGMPPSGGNALGLDRLLAACIGASGVAEVLPFPASWLG